MMFNFQGDPTLEDLEKGFQAVLHYLREIGAERVGDLYINTWAWQGSDSLHIVDAKGEYRDVTVGPTLDGDWGAWSRGSVRRRGSDEHENPIATLANRFE
jgi:hypothetical protein